jgi:hypothetical protein
VLRGAYTSRRITQHKYSRELTIICGHRPFSLTSRKEEEKEALLGKKPPASSAKRSQPKTSPKKKILFTVENHVIYIGLISCCSLP